MNKESTNNNPNNNIDNEESQNTVISFLDSIANTLLDGVSYVGDKVASSIEWVLYQIPSCRDQLDKQAKESMINFTPEEESENSDQITEKDQ